LSPVMQPRILGSHSHVDDRRQYGFTFEQSFAGDLIPSFSYRSNKKGPSALPFFSSIC
jgi:hypothetical protein